MINRISDIQTYYKTIFVSMGFNNQDIHFAGNSNKIKYEDLKGRPSICFFVESESYESNPNDTIRTINLKIEIYEIPEQIYNKVDEFISKFKRQFEIIDPDTKDIKELGVIDAKLGKNTKYDMMKESLAKATMLILLSYEIPQEVY